MISAHTEPAQFAFIPQYLDVDHADLGWQRIPLAASATDLARLEYGHQVRLATTHLPRGRYRAVRIGLLAPGPLPTPSVPVTGEPEGELPHLQRTHYVLPLGEVTLHQHEVTLQQGFCILGGALDGELVLHVSRADPRHPGAGPGLTVARSPGC